MSWSFMAFNYFVELFFFQVKMIARHIFNYFKKQELHAQVRIYLGFSRTHTWAKLHIQTQIYTYILLNPLVV